jgi:hypothetical protein
LGLQVASRNWNELGYMPITRQQANLLFQLISIRYEKGSIILTSNYNFHEWGKIFEDNVVASAIIDILVHHARIFYINGRERERGIKTKMRVKLAAKMLIIAWTLMKKKEVFNPGCIAD